MNRLGINQKRDEETKGKRLRGFVIAKYKKKRKYRLSAEGVGPPDVVREKMEKEGKSPLLPGPAQGHTRKGGDVADDDQLPKAQVTGVGQQPLAVSKADWCIILRP